MTSKRIVKNFITTYVRSIAAVILALFSSRWVFGSLGATDYGLYSIVGSLVAFVTILNTIMAVGSSRQFAYSIGQNNLNELKSWFNSAIGIHLIMASGLVMTGWPLGEYVIGHYLSIPNDRLSACQLVFRLSLVAAFINMVTVPFKAMYIAKQHIAEMSLLDMARIFLSFILAFSLEYLSGDHLIVYATGMVSIIILIQVCQGLRALFLFNECRIIADHLFVWKRIKTITSFSFWTLFGSIGSLLRDEGSSVLINSYYSPSVNAAFAIAKQVSAQANQLAAAMISALSPEITTSEGRGDRTRMLSLSSRSSKYGTILVLFFAIPLSVDIDYVLTLWLKSPPMYAGLFCQLILCSFVLERLSSGYMMAVSAVGRIAGYQATVGASFIATLPLAWFFIQVGFGPASIGFAFIISMAISTFLRVLWGSRLLKIPVTMWLTSVLTPCTVATIASVFCVIITHGTLQQSLFRLVITTLVSSTILSIFTWYYVLENSERYLLLRMLRLRK